MAGQLRLASSYSLKMVSRYPQTLICQDIVSFPGQEKGHAARFLCTGAVCGEEVRLHWCFVAEKLWSRVQCWQSLRIRFSAYELSKTSVRQLKLPNVSNYCWCTQFKAFWASVALMLLKLRHRSLSILAANVKCSNQQLQTQWQKLWQPVSAAVNSWSSSLHLPQKALASPDRTWAKLGPATSVRSIQCVLLPDVCL